MRNLLIVGAGGHGRVVADTASLTGRWSKISFLDDRFPMDTNLLWEVIASTDNAPLLLDEYDELIVAIGDNPLRVGLLKKFKEMGFSIPTIIHPDASISRFVEIGEGTVVFSQAVINAGSKIGIGAIINTGSTVDHDCDLGEGVHLSPGVKLAGGVTIGDYSWLGIGAVIIQQINIGNHVTVGAGSVVINSIESNTTVVGIPGRVIKKDKEHIINEYHV